jgi:selenocysteine lyase/cysteine desulfurase
MNEEDYLAPKSTIVFHFEESFSSFHYQLGIEPTRGTARASFYLYNNKKDVDVFLEGMRALIEASS